jgi:hypothetical protein
MSFIPKGRGPGAYSTQYKAAARKGVAPAKVNTSDIHHPPKETKVETKK